MEIILLILILLTVSFGPGILVLLWAGAVGVVYCAAVAVKWAFYVALWLFVAAVVISAVWNAAVALLT